MQGGNNKEIILKTRTFNYFLKTDVQAESNNLINLPALYLLCSLEEVGEVSANIHKPAVVAYMLVSAEQGHFLFISRYQNLQFRFIKKKVMNE